MKECDRRLIKLIQSKSSCVDCDRLNCFVKKKDADDGDDGCVDDEDDEERRHTDG